MFSKYTNKISAKEYNRLDIITKNYYTPHSYTSNFTKQEIADAIKSIQVPARARAPVRAPARAQVESELKQLRDSLYVMISEKYNVNFSEDIDEFKAKENLHKIPFNIQIFFKIFEKQQDHKNYLYYIVIKDQYNTIEDIKYIISLLSEGGKHIFKKNRKSKTKKSKTRKSKRKKSKARKQTKKR